MYRLVTFGGLGLARDGEPLARASIQRRQLALLALLASTGRTGLSRDKLVGYLWPEREPERARNLLDQALSAARRTLGPEVLIAHPASLALNPEVLESDVGEFEGALREGDHGRAVAIYAGPFLDGVFVSDAPEFERWVDGERGRLAHRFARALESLATAAESRRDRSAAVGWWRRLAQAEPLSARAATGLMRALALSGDRAGALELARVHGSLVRQQLDAAPDPTIVALAERIRSGAFDEPPVRAAAAPRSGAAGAGIEGEAGAATAIERERAPATLEPGPPVADRATTMQERGDPLPVRPADFQAPSFVHGRRAGRRRRLILALALLAVGGGAAAITIRRGIAADTDGVAASRRSIAVLPFRDISVDRGGEYFSDGFTEELITALSQVPGLRVAARTSSFALGSRGIDARAIGRQLDVATLLEGSVQRTGRRLRVTAQLVDTRNGFHVWSGRFDKDMTDVFAVQDEMAEQIVDALRPALGDSTHAPAAARHTRDLDAYALHLQGRHAWRQRNAESLGRAVEFFTRALAKDSTYADAYAGLGDVYAVLPLYTQIAVDTAYTRAEWAARRALQFDSTLAEPLATLGLMAARRYRWEAAETAFRRALAIDPNYATAHQWYGKMLGTTGRLDESETALRRAIVLDPLVPVVHYNLGQTLFWQRRHAESRAAFERALALDATFYPARTYLGFIAADQGRARDAVAEFRRVLDSRRSADDQAILAYGLARAGARDSAAAMLRSLAARAEHEIVSPADLALGHLGLGDVDAAFRWLDIALARHDSDLEAFVQSPLLEPLRTDPRWRSLLTRMRIARGGG